MTTSKGFTHSSIAGLNMSQRDTVRALLSASSASVFARFFLTAILLAVALSGLVSCGRPSQAKKDAAEKNLKDTISAVSDAVEHEKKIAESWHVSASRNPMDYVVTVVATVVREGGNNNPLLGALSVRCTGNHAEVIVSTDDIVSGGGVRVKFDDGKATSQSWGESTNHQALFAPSASAFLHSMRSARTFYLEYTPFEKGPTVASFNVADFPDRQLACVSAEIAKADAAAKAKASHAKTVAKEDKEIRDRQAKELRDGADSYAKLTQRMCQDAVAHNRPLPSYCEVPDPNKPVK